MNGGLEVLRPVLAAYRERVADPSPEVAAVLGGAGAVVHLARRWQGRAVYAVFAPGARYPTVVLKVDTSPSHQPRLEAEHAALLRVGGVDGARDWMPRSLGLVRLGPQLVLAQTGVAGAPLTVSLRRLAGSRSRASARHHELVRERLRELRGSTPERAAAAEMLDPDVVERRIATAWVDAGGHVARRRLAVGRQAAQLAVPPRETHGDLGPSNCLLSRAGVGIIDWEGATSRGNPLVDLLIFLNHYARAVPAGRGHRLMEPMLAFERAFLGGDWLGHLTRRTLAAELIELGVPAEAHDYVLLAALAELASGESATAHGARAGTAAGWAQRLRLYAAA